MIRYRKSYWSLAACLAGLAGYVDSLGFIKLGGFFVSFMSGNSTRFGVGLAHDMAAAAVAGRLVVAFVIGVVIGSGVAAAAQSSRKPAVLTLVAALLAGAALIDRLYGGLAPAVALAAAMGAENAVFQRDGEVAFGVTYMTGTLVKLGQNVAAAMMGGKPWNWLPYLVLWCSLTGGATLGALAYARLNWLSIWFAVAVAASLAVYAAALGPSDRSA
jgi:uncharacterized membrane protein YoaK (UPF0700 family)